MEETKNAVKPRLVLVGGSAGSLNVVIQLLQHLPQNFALPVVIILHRLGVSDNTLENLLLHKSNLPVKEIEDKDAIECGCAYLAPADYHLLIETDNTFSLDYSEKIQYSRPSIDVTFESAVQVYGSGLIAIILSGSNTDGTLGMGAIKNAGGITIAQSPADAEMDYMPQSAIKSGCIDYTLPATEIVDAIVRLAG